ncbi:MAG: DUF3078 domain-containing protein [Tannerellaceae bacterium]|nr:DUF3078 domain-containing protein [Tannerellaceae bacterium]
MDHFHHWVGTDDIPSNPLFLPLVYRTGLLLRRLPSLPEVTDLQPAVPFSVPRPDDPLPARTVTRAVEDSLYLFFILHRPQYFRYTTYDIPDTYIIPDYLAGEGPRELPLAFGNELRPEDLNAATLRFIPDRRYWRSAFESAIHFTQAWISPNWHKGGTGNLNLLARNLLKYDYNRDKIQFTNELEIKLNAYTAPKDTLRNYKIGEDLTRLHSNFGYRAFNKWYYTFDAEVRTQLFSNFAENTRQRMAATLSPIAFNFGIGMKYGHTTNFSGSRHRRLNLALNLAPLSYTHMYSILDTPDEIDLGRHGFHKNPATGLFDNVLRQFGSTLRADLSWQFNRNIVWQSRIYYFTSYDHVVGEFENTLTMAISRFFSTRIYLHLRFDDGVTRTPDFNTYLQANELLSFGFNYKWDY